MIAATHMGFRAKSERELNPHARDLRVCNFQMGPRGEDAGQGTLIRVRGAIDPIPPRYALPVNADMCL